MSARVVLPDADEPIRHLRVMWYELGTAHDIPVEIVSDEARSLELFTGVAGRLQVDTGSGFSAVGVWPSGGVVLGAFTAGQRRPATLRVFISSGVSTLGEWVDVDLGLGVD